MQLTILYAVESSSKKNPPKQRIITMHSPIKIEIIIN